MTTPDTLNSRTAFIGLDEEACARLRRLQPLIGSAIGPALDIFYGKVRRHEHTAAFFRNDAHIAHAKSKQEEHWKVISGASFGADYEQRVRTIGDTHARLGLEPRWYIGGYAIALEQLIGAVVTQLWPSRWQIARTPEDMSQALGVLVKAALLDMDLSISTYLEALDERRRAAEQAQKSAQEAQQCALDALSSALAKLADGDLSSDLQAELANDFSPLKANFNETVAKLRSALLGVQDSARTIAAGTQEISLAADDLSKRTEQQAASLEQTAAALDEITATVKRTAEGSQQAQDLVNQAKVNAEKAGDVVSRAVGAMGAIEKSSTQINQIIVVIDEIAFQTNLLALNAGVEAARAGEAGRGFAVVASEVRALAQRSAEAAKEIKSLLTASTTQVNAGVVLVAETGEALDRIMKQVAEINSVVTDIAAGAAEQATGLAEVNTAVNQMDQTTQQNAAMVEETTAASYALSEKTAELDRLIGMFVLGGADATTPVQTAPAARPRAPIAKAARGSPRAAPSKAMSLRAAGAPALASSPAQDVGWEEF